MSQLRSLTKVCVLLLLGGCGGGGGGGGSPTLTVTATAGPGGGISPQSVQVTRGATASFTVTPDTGYLVAAISGCGGTLQGSHYVTAPITANCQVQATFRLPEVSGVVIPQGGTAADSDVNDPFAPYAPNDDFDAAQLIPNPVTLGGYVNAPGAGPEGRSQVDGDEFDLFRVGLLEGQVISLAIASEDLQDDLDLYLLDLNGNLVDASLDVAARVESLVVPPGGAGEYFVAVHAFGGASNYTLYIGQAAPGGARALRLSDDFVPGELVVQLADPKAGAAHEMLADLAGTETAAARSNEVVQRHLRVSLQSIRNQSTAVAAAEQQRDALRRLADPVGTGLADDSPMARKLETVLAGKALARDPAVASVVPNFQYRLHTTFTPNDPRFGLQWHYPQISLPQAWPLGTGAGEIVAVVDSGVWLGHPDLSGRLVAGYDFVVGAPGGNDPGDNPRPPGGSTFHGTHVAGTIAAATDNGLGVAGVAFGARVMPLRACDTVGCTLYDIEQSLRFAAGLPNDSGTVPAQAAGVINLSLGRQGPALSAEQAIYDQLRARDIIVVASAGNDNTSQPSYPAGYPSVLAVSAVEIQGRRAYYSNFGSWIDIAAPGGDMRRDLNADGFPDGVLSTVADDRSGTPEPRYGFLQGTSMAAPHVAGVLALVRAAAPALTAANIENLLRNGQITDDLGAPGKDPDFGHGLVNAAKAVAAALDSGGQPVELNPFMAASPSSVNFGATGLTREVVLSNIGEGELVFGTPTDDSGGWLTLASAQADDRLVLTLAAQRAGLAQGIYAATVTIPSSANTVEVPVYMQVADLPSAGIGQQYVLLVDPQTADAPFQAIAEPSADGRQAFRITGVEPGSYLLVSGSDANNDMFICDAGESCGIYRGAGDVVLIEVDGRDASGLEFISGYDLPILSTQAAGAAPGRIPRARPAKSTAGVPAGD